MKVLITGANGFIGRNLESHLSSLNIDIVSFTHDMSVKDIPFILNDIDVVFHIAGVNRPEREMDFTLGNVDLTKKLCDGIALTGRKIPVLFTSSVQALLNNSYGLSKMEAENLLKSLQKDTGSPVYIYRLPNVFGKWSKPNYNSVVATFCYNIANNLPIKINNKYSLIELVYIDDVINDFVQVLRSFSPGLYYRDISPIYRLSVGELADKIHLLKSNYHTIKTDKKNIQFENKLYLTFLSYMSSND